MKKILFLTLVAILAIVAACKPSYNEEKCRKILDKPTTELSTSDVEFLLDQCDAILSSFPNGEISVENIKNSNNEGSKIEIFGKIMLKVADYQLRMKLKGETVPQSIQDKAEKLGNKMKEMNFKF